MANKLQLGDIIKTVSETEPKLNEITFYIHYYDPDDFMELVSLASLETIMVKMKNGILVDSTIQKIVLLNRGLHKGFARQNGLLPNTWLDLEFGGDVRTVIIAQVTHLEEDMIELTTFPEREVLYIDFAYKGIPKHVPLKHICFCNRPVSYSSVIDEDTQKEDDNDDLEGTDVYSEYNDDGEMVVSVPENVRVEDDYRDGLQDEYDRNMREVESLDNPYEREIETIYYGIDAQLNFLLDDFLSTLPDEKRTRKAMKKIQIHLNRYKELRELYSEHDNYGQIYTFRKRDIKHFKPLVEHMYHMKGELSWIKPVINAIRMVYVDNSSKKETNNDDDDDDIDYPDMNKNILMDLLKEESNIEKQMFHENHAVSTEVKYEKMHEYINNYYKESHPNKNCFHEPLAKMVNVNRDMDVFFGSSNDIIDAPRRQSKLNRKESIMTRIQGPIDYSHFLNKKQNELRTLMDGDKINLQSIIFMPKSVVENDRFLQSNIYGKTKFISPSYKYYIQNIEKKEVDIKKENNDTFPLDQKSTHIYLDDTVETSIHDPLIKNPVYRAFLQNVIPNTFSLIDKFYSLNADKYNITEYLEYFSPYKIEKDTLSFTSQQKIAKHLFHNIQNYNSDYMKKREEYLNFLVHRFQTKGKKPSSLLNLPFLEKHFTGKEVIMKRFYKIYNFSRNDDLIKAILSDDSEMFLMLITKLNIDLITPMNMIEPYVEPKHFFDSTSKRISKKYDKLQTMQEDNDKRDLKFDKDYDKNQYEILEKYRKERSKYTPEQFLQFFKQKLSEEFGCSLENVTALADELLLGYKLVEEGDYALLEIKPHLPPGIEECSFSENEKQEIRIETNVKKIKKYFKRVNHTWVYDADVDDESFAKPKDLTCALKSDKEYTVGKINNQTLFKSQYGENMEQITAHITKKLKLLEEKLWLKNYMLEIKMKEKDVYAIKLGNQAYISETIPSPYEYNLQDIMHSSVNFESKQNCIVFFVKSYCRSAYSNESENWYYCKASQHSVQMVPVSMYKLARGFQNNEYAKVLQKLIKERYIKSEDGRYILVHGGHILDDVEFSDIGNELAVELDENDTWEFDVSEKVDTKHVVDIWSGRKKYNNTTLRQIHNIVSAVCKNLFINIDRVEDSVITICLEFISQKELFMGEKKYKAAMVKKVKDGKFPSYETYEKSKMLDVSVCSLVIAIQCLTPSFVPKRTFGNCKKILDGYPLIEDSGSDGTLEYFACILRKMQEDRKTLPWSSIGKGKGIMEARLKKMFEIFLKKDLVVELLQRKRQYLKENSELKQEDNNVEKTWVHFLPPIHKTNILNGKTPLRNIEKSVHEELKKSLKSGNHDQWKYLGMYFSKIMSFSFGTLEAINDIVREKGSLLGKYGKVPWLENACCNDLEGKQNPIQYFAKEDERIGNYVTSVGKIGSLYLKTKMYIRSPFLHLEPKTLEVEEKNTNLGAYCHFSENLMYRTFISYCNLDSYIHPIPTYLETFINEKYEDYDVKSSIEEKIAFLKEKGKTIKLNDFNNLMLFANRNNKVQITNPLQMSYHDQVLDNLTKLKEEHLSESKIQEFGDHFEAFVNRNSIGSLDDNDTEDNKVDPQELSEKLLDNLENFLQKEIDTMKLQIIKFMENLRIRKDVIERTIKQLQIWDDKIDNIGFGHFVKNYLYYLCCIVPSYITNGNKVLDKKYDMLMENDRNSMKEVLDKKYNGLGEFSKDSLISPFIKKSSIQLRKLYKFLSKFYGFFPDHRTKLYQRFFVFSLYFVFYHFITLTEDDDVLAVIFKSVREEETNQEDENNENNNNFEEDEDQLIDDSDTEVMQLQAVDRGSLQMKVMKMIQMLLDKKEIYNRDKKSILLSYDTIRDNVDRLEDAEKIRMMDRFKKIADHKERRAEFSLKKFHIGDFYVNQNVIKTYGKKRDEMLKTEDTTEDDFLFRDDDEHDYELQENDGDSLNDIFGDDTDEDNDFDNDDDDDEKSFLENVEDEDAYDIAENAYDRL